MEKPKMLSVTDLSSYLYCPRKLYLRKVCGLREPPNKAMIQGLIRHNVLEEFGKNEQRIVESLGIMEKEDIVLKFYEELGKIVNLILIRNKWQMKKFGISADEMIKQIRMQMKQDIFLRAETIKKGMDKGYLGKELWENLSPKYIAEMTLISNKLGLKGRADRVMITDYEVVPFELKTRATDKVWPSDEVQVTAYAMMLEEKYKQEIKIGILEAGNIKHEIAITRAKKEKVVEIIESIHKMIKDGKAKYPSSFAKCQTCPFEKECGEL